MGVQSSKQSCALRIQRPEAPGAKDAPRTHKPRTATDLILNAARPSSQKAESLQGPQDFNALRPFWLKALWIKEPGVPNVTSSTCFCRRLRRSLWGFDLGLGVPIPESLTYVPGQYLLLYHYLILPFVVVSWNASAWLSYRDRGRVR